MNRDYFKEIGNAPPVIIKDKLCPKCNSQLGVIQPDRIWCINPNCDYCVLLLTGDSLTVSSEQQGA